MKQSGCVYVLTNGYMPNIVKIGATKEAPYARANQISRHEGVPGDFIVMAYVKTDDYYKVESDIHHLLRQYRLCRKEFFGISVAKAVSILAQFGEVEGTAKGMEAHQ